MNLFLFLGEWCKLFSQRAIWEKLTFEVLPYHWDDRKKLYHDYVYLDKLCEDTLGRIAVILYHIHGVHTQCAIGGLMRGLNNG